MKTIVIIFVSTALAFAAVCMYSVPPASAAAASGATTVADDPLLSSKIDSANEKMLMSEYDDALSIIEEIEKEGIGTLELELMKAEALASLERYKEAAYIYRKALDMDPENEGILISLGNISYDLEKWNEAADYYQRALERNPDSVMIRNLLGRALQELGRDSEALEHFHYAVSIDETSAESRLNEGVALVSLGRYREAADSLLMAVSLAPQSDIAYNNLSFAYYKLGKYRKALDAMRQAVHLNPDNEVLAQNLEYLENDIGKLSDFQAAKETLINTPAHPVPAAATAATPAIATSTITTDATTTETATASTSLHAAAPGIVIATATQHVGTTISARPVPLTDVPPTPTATGTAGAETSNAETRITISRAVDMGQSAASASSNNFSRNTGGRPPDTKSDRMAGNNESSAPGTKITVNPVSSEKKNGKAEVPETVVKKENNNSKQEKEIPAKPVKQATKELVQAAAKERKVEKTKSVETKIMDAEPLNAEKKKSWITEGSFADRLAVKNNTVPVEGALSPLPLPSTSLEKEIVFFGLDELPVKDFSFLKLAALRKKVSGRFYFEDQNHWIWRFNPENSYYQKLFKGSQPCVSRDSTRMVYINWDLENVGLYVYEFATALRGTVFRTKNPLKSPEFSPSGKYVSVVEISSGITRNLRVINMETLQVQVTTSELDFSSYDWDPSGDSIVIIPRDCPDNMLFSGLCIVRLDPESGAFSYDSLPFRDRKKDYPVSFQQFRSPAIEFSPSGSKLLIYDSISGVSTFYVADIESGVIDEKHFTRPDGRNLPLSSLTWGKDDNTMAFDYIGSVWISSGIDGPVFPLIASHFIVSPVDWKP